MRGRPGLQEWGRETLAQAEVTYVGSEHIRRVLAEVVGEVGLVQEVPPGVDVDLFVLEDRGAALAGLIEAARADPPNPGNAEERLPDEGNAGRLAAFLAGTAPTIVYFGKLIEQKGVQVLLEAMRSLDARLVVVGFGPYRAQLEALAPERTLFTGPLEHRHLVHLLPLATATVVPSVFPEAFGMVAAEAAAAGSPPVVARHSGLAEVAAGLEESYPARFRGLASFTSGDGCRPALSVTKATTACPLSSSGRPTTAASATAGWLTSALSTSMVPRRWPETFTTSSMRPMIQ